MFLGDSNPIFENVKIINLEKYFKSVIPKKNIKNSAAIHQARHNSGFEPEIVSLIET